MKNIIITAILALSQFCFAQTPVTKDLGSFTKLSTFAQINVTLIPSDKNKIVITGSLASDVEIINKNGQLKVRMPLSKLLKGDNISATIYYNKLESVEASEGSTINSEATFKAVSFNVSAQEGSKISLSLDVDKVTVKGSEGSIITLTGNAKTQDVLMNSGANYKAQNLITNQTTVTVNAGGEASINAKNIVDAKVRAGGNINVYGNPKQVNKKVFAGGTINEGK